MRIGIDVGGTKIEGIVLDVGGNVLARRRIDTPSGDYARTVTEIATLVRALEAEQRGTGTVGVGTPGAISPATGLVKNANSTQLIGRPFQHDLEAALGREIRVANDANCFALSEAADGAGSGKPVVFGVIIGTGAGAGIVVHGHVLTGPNAIAGEWGHNAMPWPRPDESPGPACYCGKYGCLETFVSGPGLANDFHATSGRKLLPPQIIQAARSGDRHAQACVTRYEDRLARGLAQVINILDPDVIVLGGGMSNVGRLYDNVPGIWGRYVFSDRVDTELRPPVHGDSSGVRGAAWLWPHAGTGPL